MRPLLLTTYQKLCTEFYDLELERDEAAALAFFMQYGREAAGPILEPMCGTGRFLLPMLQTGFDAEGFDASPFMLAAFEQKHQEIFGRAMPAWQAFVEEFTSERQYSLIFIPFGSWGLITDLAAAAIALRKFYDHLLPGGRLVLEIETIASLPLPCGIERRGVHTRRDGSKIALTTTTSYDSATQIFRSLCRYESIREGRIEAVEQEDFQQRLYGFAEMEHFLMATGFTHVEKFQSYAKRKAVDEHSPVLLYECTKARS